jgi:NhaP-type Na+/H+ or K+/H+ antiporter
VPPVIEDIGLTLFWLGALLLLALASEWVGLRTPLPRVSILLVVGIAIGPAGLNLLPELILDGEPIATTLALTIVGFLLGWEFEQGRLRENGPAVLVAALVGSVVTAGVVAAGLVAVGAEVQLALALAGISAATGPAAIRSVIREKRADGPLTHLVLGLTAILDAIGIVLFSLLIAVGAVLTGEGGSGGLFLTAARELGGGVLLGVAVGLPSALLAGRLRTGDPIFLHALAIVLVIAGVGLLLEVSVILAAVVAGAVVVNVDRSEERPFDVLESVQWPFLAIFFIYGGAALSLEGVEAHTLLIVGYIALRLGGKLLGGYLSAVAVGMRGSARRWLGPALLPQAGIALGLALLAGDRFPDLAETIVPVVVVSTVLFEFAGPIATQLALQRSGEADAAARRQDAARGR